MTIERAFKALAKLGRLPAGVAGALEDLAAFQERRVEPGEPLDEERLMDMARVTDADLQMMAADWRAWCLRTGRQELADLMEAQVEAE